MKYVAKMQFNTKDYFLAGVFDSYEKAEQWAQQYRAGVPGCMGFTILQIIPYR
jgi:hypothetical protein